MNKKTSVALTAIAITAIIVAIILYTQGQQERKLAREKIDEHENDKYKLILDSINNYGVSAEVKSQLIKLFERFRVIDEALANEIGQALQLISIGQQENAIEDLAKIIDNLLKKLYCNKTDFKSWLKSNKRKADFHSHLDYCHHEDKIITKIEYKFIQAVKEIRNTEAHELDLKLDVNTSASGLLSAIHGIAKIGALVYPTVTPVLD